MFVLHPFLKGTRIHGFVLLPSLSKKLLFIAEADYLREQQLVKVWRASDRGPSITTQQIYSTVPTPKAKKTLQKRGRKFVRAVAERKSDGRRIFWMGQGCYTQKLSAVWLPAQDHTSQLPGWRGEDSQNPPLAELQAVTATEGGRVLCRFSMPQWLALHPCAYRQHQLDSGGYRTIATITEEGGRKFGREFWGLSVWLQ